jgi:hypothetical protein
MERPRKARVLPPYIATSGARRAALAFTEVTCGANFDPPDIHAWECGRSRIGTVIYWVISNEAVNRGQGDNAQ